MKFERIYKIVTETLTDVTVIAYGQGRLGIEVKAVHLPALSILAERLGTDKIAIGSLMDGRGIAIIVFDLKINIQSYKKWIEEGGKLAPPGPDQIPFVTQCPKHREQNFVTVPSETLPCPICGDEEVYTAIGIASAFGYSERRDRWSLAKLGGMLHEEFAKDRPDLQGEATPRLDAGAP